MNTQKINVQFTAEEFALVRDLLTATASIARDPGRAELADQAYQATNESVQNPFEAEVCETHPDRRALYALVLDGPAQTVVMGACDECAHALRLRPGAPYGVREALSPLVWCEGRHWEGTDPKCPCFAS